MSREIKFRAWDIDNKKYEYDIAIRPINRIIGVEIYNNEIYPVEFRRIVEQYTGLKDKNGKEIYEGDIVRTTDRVTVKDLIFPIGVVEFKQQAFWICNVPSGRPDFTHNETLLKYWETDLEVIGNIHENPELLEGK